MNEHIMVPALLACKKVRLLQPNSTLKFKPTEMADHNVGPKLPRSNLILKDNDEYDPTAVHESGDDADVANDLAADEPHRSLFRQQCLTDEMEALTLPMNRLGLPVRREAAGH